MTAIETPDTTAAGDDTSTATGPDFADVYATELDAVWRFVRNRIADPQEAHDVTADVFVRAWRSWDRYDPRRGPVQPWLFTIARRAVIDRLRRVDREEPVAALPAAMDVVRVREQPDQQVLRSELLAQLGQALDGLKDRERDALAMRFAARLSMATIAEVLGTTTGVAKMTIHRAIRRLGDAIDDASTTSPPADLELVIDRVVQRGHADLGTEGLERLLVHVAAVHDPGPVPEDLGQHVAGCVRCAAEEATTPPVDKSPTTGRRRTVDAVRGGGILATLLSFAGVCLACTVPAAHALMVAVGIVAASYVVHLVGVAAAPFVVWLVWRGVRRHGRHRARNISLVGGVLMGVHALLHVLLETVGDTALGAAWVVALFVGTDWFGTALLVIGAALNLRDLGVWRRTQAGQLAAA